MSATHHDEEISLVGYFAGKVAKIGLEVPVLLAVAFLLWAALRLPGLAGPGHRPQLLTSRFRFLLPPSRAPPHC